MTNRNLQTAKLTLIFVLGLILLILGAHLTVAAKPLRGIEDLPKGSDMIFCISGISMMIWSILEAISKHTKR